MTDREPFASMYSDMAKVLGNAVQCRICGQVATVDSADCLRHGWPKCHGQTMSLRPSGPRSKSFDGGW